jgi:hypothetical protein
VVEVTIVFVCEVQVKRKLPFNTERLIKASRSEPFKN